MLQEVWCVAKHGSFLALGASEEIDYGVRLETCKGKCEKRTWIAYPSRTTRLEASGPPLPPIPTEA
jgi:hypothetical protein